MIRITKDKNVYAAFTNMAQHNFIITMRRIHYDLGVDNQVKDADPTETVVSNLASKKYAKDKKLKACQLLRRHLPFLVPMADDCIANGKAKDEIEAFCFLLPKISKVLSFYRNYTTHFDSDEDDEMNKLHLNERSLVYCLKALFKAALRTVQQRFSYEEREISFIKNKDMGKSTSKYSLSKKEVISSTDDKPAEVLSKRGLLLFISLFLEKKYINELLAKTKEFYRYEDLNSAKRKSIIFEAVSVYRINLPYVRYDSERDYTMLALDMLNELQRCPRELFDLLSRADQELFRSEPKDDDSTDTMLMLRYDDRFPQLALRYIDNQEVLKSIRFQINLGKYRFAFYNKKCIDNALLEKESRVRSLQKELHGFGRLNEIEKERREQWAALIRDFDDVEPDTAATTPYITDHHASYLISNNRIGLYWKAGKDDPKPGLPMLSANPQARDLLERRKSGEPVVTLVQPKCFISVHELPALVFYHLLLEDLGAEKVKDLGLANEERVIKNWADGFKSMVEKVLDGSVTHDNVVEQAAALGIDYVRQIPKKLQQYLSSAEYDDSRNNKKLQERLSTMIVENEKFIARLEKDLERVADKRNRRGTKKFVEIKPGRLGSWLAHDIIALQPTPVEGNKLTGLNFQILQSALSVYDDFDHLRRILVSARLIGTERPHPFLEDVVRGEPKTVILFYKRYLEKRLSWLKQLASTDLRAYPFITRGSGKWAKRDGAFYTGVLNQYLTLPVELPRGLFTEAIKTALEHIYGKPFVKGDKRDEANVAFLIAKYFKQKYQDDSQEFYTQPGGMYRRHYAFFKALLGEENHGRTIAEIDTFLRNDSSLQLLTGGESDGGTASIDKETLESALYEIRTKLAKALAKNPNINKEQRIKDILNTSQKLRKLTATAQNKILLIALGGAKPKNEGLIADYLSTVEANQMESEKSFLTRTLHTVKSTERLIRRYRVEDIIIFLMARDILFDEDSETFGKFSDFKLRNIRPIRRQQGESALEIKVPFTVTLRLKGCDKPVRITQESIKLKNYGDFHRFLNDSRIATLIPYLDSDESAVAVTVKRADLEREFENYDHERLEVFAAVHKIEQLILERHSELKDKTSPEYYYLDNGKNKAKRTNFRELLMYSSLLPYDEQGEAINIRNSFSHNLYKGEGFDKVRIKTTTIGDIASAIRQNIDDKMTQIKKNHSDA